jgi:hypothetical protein
MVVVRTMRDPGVAGFAEDEMVHELIPTLPKGTEITVGVCNAVVEVDEVEVSATVVVVVPPEPTTKVKRELVAKL